MVEAVRTTASPAAVWTICVVVVACLLFWLAAIAWADMHPIVRHRRLPMMPGPVLGGIHMAEGGRSVAPNRDASAVLADVVTAESGAGAGDRVPAGAVPGQRPGEERQASGQPQGQSADGQPAQPQPAGTAKSGVPVPPAQRSGEADRPEHSVTGPGAASTPGGAAGGAAGR